jgi:hypothetical protein
MKRFLLCLTTAAALTGGLAQAANIQIVGGWATTINASLLVAGAGSNLQSSVTSIAGESVVSLSGAPKDWVVLARLMPGAWHPQVTLQVRRSSAGSGSGFVTGGESFISLTSTNTIIFSGEGHRDGVAIQYRLTGMSCQVAPGTYSAPILFTVQ